MTETEEVAMRKVVAGLAMTLDGVVEAPSGNWMRFDDVTRQVDLELVESRPLKSGVLLATYEPASA